MQSDGIAKMAYIHVRKPYILLIMNDLKREIRVMVSGWLRIRLISPSSAVH